MSRVELLPRIAGDLERILDHFESQGAADPMSRIQSIVDALDVLRSNPMIGRRNASGSRELVIGRRTRGFVALYRHEAEIDTVLMMAIRGQREAGFRAD